MISNNNDLTSGHLSILEKAHQSKSKEPQVYANHHIYMSLKNEHI